MYYDKMASPHIKKMYLLWFGRRERNVERERERVRVRASGQGSDVWAETAGGRAVTRSQPPSGLMTTSSIPVAVDSYELDHSGSASKGTEYSLRRPTAGPHRSLADICKGGGGAHLERAASSRATYWMLHLTFIQKYYEFIFFCEQLFISKIFLIFQLSPIFNITKSRIRHRTRYRTSINNGVKEKLSISVAP